ncbi:hypothetical protein KRX19_02025 [Cardiobacteriaceae bacterium TAE3-ERU3]|nr:hypothetical protein [Cardiobacteriaceae bacterium TAE3-ERU3]
MNQRKNFLYIRDAFLLEGFACSTKRFHDGKIHRWVKDGEEWHGAYQACKKEFSLPIEQLMLLLIYTVSLAGRDQEQHIINKNKIDEIIEQYGLENLIKDLSTELDEDGRNEKTEFTIALNAILKFELPK